MVCTCGTQTVLDIDVITLLLSDVQSVVVSMSVCLFAHISHKVHVQYFTKFLMHVIAQLTSDDNTVYYLLSILWITLSFT